MTFCLTHAPHGRFSSHWRSARQLHTRARGAKQDVAAGPAQRTLTFLSLQREQPLRDFLCPILAIEAAVGGLLVSVEVAVT